MARCRATTSSMASARKASRPGIRSTRSRMRGRLLSADLGCQSARAMRRVLIIKLSSLGDVAQALPVASALRKRFPELRVTWAVEERCAALVHGHAGVDRVITIPSLSWGAVGRGWSAACARALRAVRAERYDVALDLQGLLKSSVVALWSRAPVRLGVTPQREGAALVSRAVAVRVGRCHSVDRYLDAAAFLCASRQPVRFGLVVQPTARASLGQLLRQHGAAAADPLIVIAPSPSRGGEARAAPPLAGGPQ